MNILNCHARCEFANFEADNYDALILLTVLFPTVINQF